MNRWVSTTYAKALGYSRVALRAITLGVLANSALGASASELDKSILPGSRIQFLVTYSDEPTFAKIGFSQVIRSTGVTGLGEAINRAKQLAGEGRDANDPYYQRLQQFIKSALARIEWIYDEGWGEQA